MSQFPLSSPNTTYISPTQCYAALVYLLGLFKTDVEVKTSQVDGAVWAYVRMEMASMFPGTRLHGGIICDGTGTGKTLKMIMITLMLMTPAQGGLSGEQSLALVPSYSIADGWVEEGARFFKDNPVAKVSHDSIPHDVKYDAKIVVGIYHSFSTDRNKPNRPKTRGAKKNQQAGIDSISPDRRPRYVIEVCMLIFLILKFVSALKTLLFPYILQ
jgi:hypothetical protein